MFIAVLLSGGLLLLLLRLLLLRLLLLLPLLPLPLLLLAGWLAGWLARMARLNHSCFEHQGPWAVQIGAAHTPSGKNYVIFPGCALSLPRGPFM